MQGQEKETATELLINNIIMDNLPQSILNNELLIKIFKDNPEAQIKKELYLIKNKFG